LTITNPGLSGELAGLPKKGEGAAHIQMALTRVRGFALQILESQTIRIETSKKWPPEFISIKMHQGIPILYARIDYYADREDHQISLLATGDLITGNRHLVYIDTFEYLHVNRLSEEGVIYHAYRDLGWTHSQ
jgi:hypothetical protein